VSAVTRHPGPPSPRPGSAATLPATRGRRVAAGLILATLLLVLFGAARASQAEIVLAPGEPLTHETASLLVLGALQAQAPGTPFRLELRRPVLPLANTSPVAVSVALAQWRHDPVSGEWRGQLVVRGADGRGGTLPIEGLAREQVVVPVPAVPVEAGTLIDPARLRAVAVDRVALPPGAVMDAAELEGQRARRRLAAGRPVVASDLQEPASVQKGEIVTVVFERGPLRLTLLGKALEAGAIGQAVRVLNTDSGRAVSAIVTGPREVQVGTASGRAS